MIARFIPRVTRLCAAEISATATKRRSIENASSARSSARWLRDVQIRGSSWRIRSRVCSGWAFWWRTTRQTSSDACTPGTMATLTRAMSLSFEATRERRCWAASRTNASRYWSVSKLRGNDQPIQIYGALTRAVLRSSCAVDAGAAGAGGGTGGTRRGNRTRGGGGGRNGRQPRRNRDAGGSLEQVRRQVLRHEAIGALEGEVPDDHHRHVLRAIVVGDERVDVRRAERADGAQRTDRGPCIRGGLWET